MKKIIALTFALVLVLSLTACGMANDVVNNTESMGSSIVSDVESDIDRVESDVADGGDSSMNLMAGITVDDAKQAALKHAGLTESQISDLDIDLDRDNGKLIYEVDFNSGNTEYDYDINAQTGEVISADKSKD